MSAIDPATLPVLESRRLLGGEVLAVDAEAGTGAVRFVLPAAMANPNGTVQGGYVAAALDDVVGMVTFFGCGRRYFSTLQMSLTYLRPVPVGVPLHGEARVVAQGRRQAVVDGWLAEEGADGRVLVRCTNIQVFVGDG